MRRAVTAALLAVAVLPALLAGGPAATATTAAPPSASPSARGSCDSGELCLWAGTGFRGARNAWDLARAGVESCVPLPEGAAARSLANRLGRPVTVYQDRECATEGEFDTYPGSGTWAPETPFVVRAFQVWES
ncbi:hypothetical protein GCM10027168_36910 [Streptomyces capparidis]